MSKTPRLRNVDENKSMDEKWDRYYHMEERGSYTEMIHVYR